MKINQDIYKQLVQNISMIKIVLESVNVKKSNLVVGPNPIKVELSYSCDKYNLMNDKIEFYADFDVNLSNDKDEELVNINFTFRAIYNLSNLERYTKEYIEKFKDKNVPINVWPYAREFVSSITARLGYPPLFIPPYGK